MSDDAEATTAGAANFDNFKMYFSQFIMLAVCMAHGFPIIGKLLDNKPLEWGSKLKTGWNYICGQSGRAIEIKESH